MGLGMEGEVVVVVVVEGHRCLIFLVCQLMCHWRGISTLHAHESIRKKRYFSRVERFD